MLHCTLSELVTYDFFFEKKNKKGMNFYQLPEYNKVLFMLQVKKYFFSKSYVEGQEKNILRCLPTLYTKQKKLRSKEL